MNEPPHEGYNLDDIVVINRNPEQQKLVSELLDDKKLLYSKDEINILNNKIKFYNVKDGKITNISQNIIDYENNNTMNPLNESNIFNMVSTKINNDNLSQSTIDKLNKISTVPSFQSNKTSTINNCDDIALSDYSCSNNLNNYYRDIYGNTIKSSMNDYISAYNTTIDETNAKKCIPVKTLKGKNDFIIPNQYDFEKYWTNAYNVDYSRVINPLTIF